jgi:SNF2 family DNA or RNA helicase
VANRRNAEQQLKDNLQDVYFARSQEEVTDIPPWLFEDIDIAMTDKQQAVYDKLRKDLLIHIADEPDAAPIKIKTHIALMLRSLQVLSNPVLVGSVNSSGKWSALDELMYIYPGPYLVWVNFIRTGEMLREALSVRFGQENVALVNGSTSMEMRNATVEALQEGHLEVIVLNNAVGKFGFNLTKARTAFFVERMYDDSYFQCLYRNRRIGTTESPIVINMRSVTTLGRRTLDHAVHDTLDYRTGMIRSLTIGDIRRALL